MGNIVSCSKCMNYVMCHVADKTVNTGGLNLKSHSYTCHHCKIAAQNISFSCCQYGLDYRLSETHLVLISNKCIQHNVPYIIWLNISTATKQLCYTTVTPDEDTNTTVINTNQKRNKSDQKDCITWTRS